MNEKTAAWLESLKELLGSLLLVYLAIILGTPALWLAIRFLNFLLALGH